MDPIVGEGTARRFVLTFALGALILLGPFVGMMGRLVALGEIDIGVGADRMASLKGTLFADAPVQKLRDALERRPEVLVLGSSRVGAIRADMFAGCAERPACFYNAASGMPTIRTGLDFMRALVPGSAPRVLILGIDVWVLDPEHVRVERDEYQLRRDLRGQLDHAVAVTRGALQVAATDRAIRDVLLGLAPVSEGASGLAAIAHQVGYREDGSVGFPDEAWQRALAVGDAGRSEYYLRLVRIGAFGFEPFEQADEGALRDLVELLSLARSAGTAVVAYTPPFSESLTAAMRAQPHYAGGVADVYATLARTFAAAGVPFLDRMSLAEYGCAADEHIDGAHTSEVCSARILLALAQDPAGDPFRGYVDAPGLAARLGARPSSFTLPR